MRRLAGPEGIEKVLNDYELDVLLVPTDSPISTVATFAGYPVSTMPLGYLEPSGRPHGVSVLSRPREEGKILRAMSAYGATSFQRQLPGPLVRAIRGSNEQRSDDSRI